MTHDELTAALTARVAAKARGDKAAYLAAAKRCGELARELRDDDGAAGVSAEVAAWNARQRERVSLAALRKRIARAYEAWHRAQEWPQCGQGVPSTWADMVPAAVRADRRAIHIMREFEE